VWHTSSESPLSRGEVWEAIAHLSPSPRRNELRAYPPRMMPMGVYFIMYPLCNVPTLEDRFTRIRIEQVNLVVIHT
jgi:hypothetical protein